MAKKPLIGTDKLYYALLNSDTTAGVSYQTPIHLVGAISVSYNPNSTIATLFADDGPFETEETIGEIELEVGVADISQEDYAVLLGHTITAGVMEETNLDQPVNVAVGFRAKRTGGTYSYFWFYKGKFSKPIMDHETKGDAISYQTPVMMWKGTIREYDSKFKASTRSDADDYTATTGSTWFDAVYGVTADTTAPTFSSSDPSAGSTSATQTTNITITFSEPVLTSTITADNLVIIQGSSSATIDIDSFAVSSAIVTLTQSTFTASTTYDVIMTTGIKDEAGNKMSGAYTFRFTTSV